MITNPVAPSEDNLIAGGKIYLSECSGCHGTPGKPNEPDSLNPERLDWRRRGRNIRRHRFSGWRSTGSGAVACSRMAFGIPTRNCGRWRLTFTGSRIFLQEWRKKSRLLLRNREVNKAV